MLVVNRKHDEKIVILTSDGAITVAVVDTGKNRAKLSISAPKTIQIFREELLSAATRAEVAHAS